MRRYETQNTLLICKEPIAKAFYTNSGQKAFVYIGSPGGRSNGRLRICNEKFFNIFGDLH